MKFRKATTLLLSAMMTLSLAACGTKAGKSTNVSKSADTSTSTKAEETDTKSGDKTVLRMAWWGSQTRHDATVAVIKMYEEQNPTIHIESEFYDSDGYFTKLNTLVASNTVWDIFQLGGNFPTYIDKIVPMNDYIENGTIDVSNTTEAFLATTAWDGKQLGISNGVNCYGIVYDPKLFSDAGVPEPVENWTWDDFSKAVLQIHDKLDIYGFSSSAKDLDFVQGCSMGISQEGYDLNFFALSNDKLGFDDPSMLVNYLKMKKELVDAGAYPDPGALAEIKDVEGDYLVAGEAAMSWVASNQMPTLAVAAGRELKLAPAPRKTADGPSGSILQSSQMLCISADSKTPDEAAKFISFFENDEEANKILNGERGVSIMSNVREMLEDQADDSKKAMYDFVTLIGSFKTGEVNVISPTQKAEIEDQFKLLVEQVIFGEKTPEQAAQEIFDFATEKFK